MNFFTGTMMQAGGARQWQGFSLSDFLYKITGRGKHCKSCPSDTLAFRPFEKVRTKSDRAERVGSATWLVSAGAANLNDGKHSLHRKPKKASFAPVNE